MAELEIVYWFFDGSHAHEPIESLEWPLPATAQSLWAQASFKGSDDNPLQSVEVRPVGVIAPKELLLKAMKLLLNASDILLTVTNESGDEELTINDWLRFGAYRNAAKGRPGGPR